MPQLPINREIAFTIMDVARMLRTYADQRARQFGISRAQWGVLVRLDRSEGLKQSELAEILDLQPISLTRLLDRLAENGLIERRADPNDRRANRLFLMPAARPLLEQLAELGKDMMATVLDGSRSEVERAPAARSRAGEGQSALGHRAQRDPTTSRQWLSVMSEKALESRSGAGIQDIAGTQERDAVEIWIAGAARPQAAAHDPAGRPAGARGADRLRHLSDGRTLYLHRQRLCRRAEGADHAGHLRQGHPCRGARRPARQARRRAAHARPRALPARARAGAGQARGRAHRLQQAQEQSHIARHAGRPRQEECRAQAARCRPQDQAGELAGRLAGRCRYRRRRAGDRAIAGAVHRPAARRHAQSAARRPRPADREISRPMRRPRPRSTRRNAISTTPRCARRFPAPPRRSTTSSSAALSPPARRS